MKYIIISFCCSLIFISCARQPLNVYSPHPINTAVVKENGDVGVNVNYFSNGPRNIGEGAIHSNGIALQTRVATINNLFLESTINNLKENTKRDLILIGTRNDSVRYISASNTTYNNFEIGVGKIFNLNTTKSSNLLLSAGYGKTNFKNNFTENEGGRIANADFYFNNKHIYLNTIFQLQSGIFMYQGGFKFNFTKFENIITNNTAIWGTEAQELKRSNSDFRSFVQFYQDFGIVPSKKSDWLSLHLNFGINGRNNLNENFYARRLSVGFSVMASPSGLLKRKK